MKEISIMTLYLAFIFNSWFNDAKIEKNIVILQIKENSIPYDMNIAVLISGGVDSSVVVHQLCEQGYKPALFYIRIGRDDVDYMDCTAEEDMEICTAVAHKYGLKLELIDLHREYWDKLNSLDVKLTPIVRFYYYLLLILGADMSDNITSLAKKWLKHNDKV